MTGELTILLSTTAVVGFFHTLLGPDHYLPFIAMAQSGKWSLMKTSLITTACGLGHVLGSVILGTTGIMFGVTVSNLEIIDGIRGDLAAWALIGFGLIYFIWGIRRAIRNKPHDHFHGHENGLSHSHLHQHYNGHVHIHKTENRSTLTPWVLFSIFILGPCEPLIPLLMYPAAKNSYFDLLLVVLLFTFITVITMLAIVIVSISGITLLPVKRFEKYMHAISGIIVLMSGLSIQFLGL